MPGHTAAAESASVLLAVSSDPKDPEVLEVNLKGWRVHWAPTCNDALAILKQSACDVVLCERELPDGGWRDLLAGLGALRDALPLVVMSGAADESMWAEVLRDGGFDLLAKPLEDREVCRVLPTARLHRRPLRAVAAG
jgi:two-component system, NtrC family, response regulator HydG